MGPIAFRVALFRSEAERAYSEATMHDALAFLVRANRRFLRMHPSTPSLYTSGVRYRREDETENWDGIPTCIDNGSGDCEDLAAWRVAEVLERPEERAKLQGVVSATPQMLRKILGTFTLYHIICRYQLPSGQIVFEDPSARLGMHEGGDNLETKIARDAAREAA